MHGRFQFWQFSAARTAQFWFSVLPVLAAQILPEQQLLLLFWQPELGSLGPCFGCFIPRNWLLFLAAKTGFFSRTGLLFGPGFGQFFHNIIGLVGGGRSILCVQLVCSFELVF